MPIIAPIPRDERRLRQKAIHKLVWRRAAPTLRIRDPYKDEKMAAIHNALDECSAEHPVFYEDEVDIHQGRYFFHRRSNSAFAKYAEAWRRISLLRRSSRFSRSSSLRR